MGDSKLLNIIEYINMFGKKNNVFGYPKDLRNAVGYSKKKRNTIDLFYFTLGPFCSQQHRWLIMDVHPPNNIIIFQSTAVFHRS